MALLDERDVKVICPLGPGVFVLRSLVGSEDVWGSDYYDLELASDEPGITADKVLGTLMAVELATGSGVRHFSGYAISFQRGGVSARTTVYRIRLVPWIQLLKYSKNSRIFQPFLPPNEGGQSEAFSATVPKIAEWVFRGHGFSDFEDSALTRDGYEERPLTIQYNESDYNFVHRLFSQAGVYYFHTHESGRPTLVMSDSPASHSQPVTPGPVPFYPPAEAAQRDEECFTEWGREQTAASTEWIAADYDFSLRGTRTGAFRTLGIGERSDFTQFDYAAGGLDEKALAQVAETRINHARVNADKFAGVCNLRTIAPGKLLTLKNVASDMEGPFVVTDIDITLTSNSLESGADNRGFSFTAGVTAVPSSHPLAPNFETMSPAPPHLQSASVVGPKGEEIHTDDMGRVKVRFHWDRFEKKEPEKTTCFLPVAQMWAGDGFGAVFTPRIGDEVLVSFLDGDIDRPVITGRMYTAADMPPIPVRQNPTQSVIRTRSSKGGGPDNFNEILFDDLKGNELFRVQAEKDQKTLVKHDQTLDVGNDRTKTIKGNETRTIEKSRKTTITENDKTTIDGQREETVKKDEMLTVEGNQTKTVKLDETVTIKGNRKRAVTKNDTFIVDQNHSVHVKGTQSVHVEKAQTLINDDAVSQNIAKSRSVEVKASDQLKVKTKLTFEAGEEILIKCGAASIQLSKNGDIVVKGNNLTLQASAGLTGKASGELTLKGSKGAIN